MNNNDAIQYIILMIFVITETDFDLTSNPKYLNNSRGRKIKNSIQNNGLKLFSASNI